MQARNRSARKQCPGLPACRLSCVCFRLAALRLPLGSGLACRSVPCLRLPPPSSSQKCPSQGRPSAGPT
eukprot:8772794-Heterocapsa_arctica.AAC.1